MFERVGVSTLVLALFAGCYFGAAQLTGGADVLALRTALDDRTPFWPSSVIIYAAVYPLALLPAFIVAPAPLFRRVALAYAVVILLAALCFVLLPTSAADLRLPLNELDSTRFDVWGLGVLYAWDPPANLFPSLHLALALLASLVAWNLSPAVGAPALGLTALIAIATTTTRQHYWLDALAGVTLAVVVHYALLRRVYPRFGRRALDWRGAWRWLFLCIAFYATFYLGFSLEASVAR